MRQAPLSPNASLVKSTDTIAVPLTLPSLNLQMRVSTEGSDGGSAPFVSPLLGVFMVTTPIPMTGPALPRVFAQLFVWPPWLAESVPDLADGVEPSSLHR